MNDYSHLKTGQYKNDPLSLAMASVPVFPPRPVTCATNPFQSPSIPSAYTFNMDGSLGHTASLYNPPSSHLPNTSKMGSRPPEEEILQMSHSFTKPPTMIYHNFTPLNSCNIVTTNGFFNLNTTHDIPKHSFEDLLNLPPSFNTDSSINAQMVMPKAQYLELTNSVTTDNRQYFQESVNSYVQNLSPLSHGVQIAESKKLVRDQKGQSKVTVTNPEDDVHRSPCEDASPLNSELVSGDVVNDSITDIVGSDDEPPIYCDKDIYKCGFCELKVSSNEALLEHLNSHSSFLPFHCGICGMVFSEGVMLVNHVQKKHAVKPPYACGLCNTTFHKNDELKRHISAHDKHDSSNSIKLASVLSVKEKIKATEKADTSLKQEDSEPEEEDGESEHENCDPSMFNMNPAANTIIIGKDTNFSLRKGPSKIVMDDVDISSVCTIIIEPSSAGGVRKKHLFKCNYCEKVCKDKGSLVSHVRTHTKGRPYECNVCLAKFKQYAHLSDHVMTKHTKERPFVCDRCAKTFNRKSHLQDHIRLRHTEDKLYHCPECNATFQKRADYSEHKRVHGKPPKYQCNMCPRQFRNVTDYERHIRSHTKEKRFECEVCHLTFGLLANAKKHMVKHNEERPFKCDVCPKAYHFEHDFKRHQLTHLNKKPFPCSDCYKSFKNASLLKKHAKEMHMKCDDDSSKKPFKCLTCRKRFRIQWDLDRHRKIHARKKPFPCLYCYRTYGSESMLAKHARVHDGQNLPLYDHSKDLIEESEVDTKKKKRGRKPKNTLEEESRDLGDVSDADKRPKRRGRPPKRKIESVSKEDDNLISRRRQPRQKSESDSGEESAPSIKVTFRHNKLRQRKFSCPNCNQTFMSKTMLEKHVRTHEDEGEETDEYQTDSTNNATSLKESSNDNTNGDIVDGTRADYSTRGEDITQDGNTTWDNTSDSDDDDDDNSLSVLKNGKKKPRTSQSNDVPHFSLVRNQKHMED